MTPNEIQAFLASPSGVAAVEAGAAPLRMAGFTQAFADKYAKRVLSAVLVAGLLIPKEDA